MVAVAGAAVVAPAVELPEDAGVNDVDDMDVVVAAKIELVDD